MKTISILLIEDNFPDVILIKEMLKEIHSFNHNLVSATTLKESREQIQKNNFDILLLDLNLPDSTGEKTFQEVNDCNKKIPVILITGSNDDELAIKLIKKGAQDYITKQNLNSALLSKSILYSIERKQSEETLIASETRYRRLFEAAKDGILILDVETGMIDDVNPFLIKLLGYSKEQFLEKEIWEIGFLRDIVTNHDKFIELQENEYVRYDDLPLETADGRKINVEFVSNVYLVNGKKVIQCNIRDITERRKTEKALQTNNLRLELAMKVANMAWWEMDITTGNVTFEKRKAEMLGYQPEQFKHYTDFMALVHPEDNEKAMNAMRGHIEGSIEKYEIEYRILTKSGEYKWFYDIGSVVKKDLQGKPLIVTGLVIDISVRKLAEIALRESEHEFRQLAESMPQIVWITRPDGWNIYFNQQWVDYTGLTLEESYGNGWNKPFHPDDQQKAWDAWQNATKNNDIYSIQSRLRSADGEYKWWLVRGVPVMDEHGTILKWFGTCTDINESKLTEIALRESEFSLKNAQAVAKIGSWETNLSDLSVIWSDEIYHIFGIDKDVFEVSHTAFLSFIHPDDKKIVDDAFVTSLEKHSFNIIDHKIITSSGLVKFVEERWQIVFDDNGKPLKVVGTCQDISERKLAEIAVRESEEKFRSYIESAPDGLFIVDNTGRYVEVNKAAYDMLGYSEEEILNFSIRDLLAEESYEEGMAHFKKIIETGRATSDLVYKHKDGSTRWLTITAVKLSQTRILGFAKDITEHKQAEQEKFKAIFLAQEREQNRIASDLHDGVGQTIAAANMYMNALTSLVKDQLDAETLETFMATKKLVHEAATETRLVSHNIMPPSLKQYGIEDTINELIGSYKKIQSGITFKFISTFGNKRFDGEIELNIYRCVKEIMSNALKHAKANEIKVELDAAGTQIIIKVTDNGIGFDLKKNNKNIGIGLTNLAQRVESLGGEFLIETAPNKGTKITLILKNCVEKMK